MALRFLRDGYFVGTVGIGTASPQQKLHVQGGGVRVEDVGTGLGGFVSVGNNTEAAGNYSAYFFGNTALDQTYFKGGIAYETLASTNGRGDMHFLQDSNANSSNATIADSVMTILNGGNVGIGTTGPATKLDVRGQLLVAGDTPVARIGSTLEVYRNGTTAELSIHQDDSTVSSSLFSQLRFRNGGNDTYFKVPQNGNGLIIDVESKTNAFVIGTTGNVGIGTDNPETITSTVSTLTLNGTSGTVSGGFAYQVNGTTKAYSYVENNYLRHQAQSGVGQYWFADGSIKMAMLSGGNVGIGTTSPDGVLHIKKDNAPATFEIQGGLNTQTTAGAINGEINFGVNDPSTTGGIGASIKNISQISNGAHNGLAFYTGLQSRTPYLQQMLYFTAQGGLSFGTTNTAYGTSGQILKSNADAPPSWVNASTVIGGPYLPLAGGTMTGVTQFNDHTNYGDQVYARWGASQDLQIYHDGSNSYITDSGTGDLIITADNDLTFKDGSGNIMANMNASNSVELMFGNAKKFETTSTGVTVTGAALLSSGEYLSWGTAGATSIEGSTASNKLQFRTSSTDRMIINDTGVGIGTTSPSSKLEVVGNGGTVLDIQGSQGQLFSVTDSLSGDIFAVADISGVPIFTVNSSGLSTFDGNLSISELIYHTGDIGTSIQMIPGQMVLKNSGGKYINLHSNGTTYFESSAYQFNTGNATFIGSVITPTIITDSVVAKTTSGNITFKTNGGVTIAQFANDKSATFQDQVFATVATSSGDGSSTLTTKGYVDGLITGATIYRGTWDPDITANSGNGTPDLSTVTQTSGYYYICSDIGTAHPNGTTGSPAVPCEPDSWAVGDWVIWNDDIPDCAGTGTGAWQKIDNTSVLSGIGTGQTVALWEGAGSVTDSETLGNAPITVSGGDTTITGNLGVGAVNTSYNLYNNGTSYFNGSVIVDATFTQTGGAASTFSGDVTATANYTASASKIIYKAQRSGGAVAGDWSYDDATTDMSLGTSTAHSFSLKTGNTRALTIDASQNSVFAGTVTSPTFLGDLNGTINTLTTAVTQSASNNSTKVATTAYADAAAAAVDPSGVYLPLAGGTLTGGLIGTTVKYNTQLSTNDLMGQKAFIGISSGSGAQKFKIYKNTNTTDGYARFKIDRAFDYGNSDQMVQEAIFQRRNTTKNFVFRYDGDIATGDDVYLEVYELSNGQVEIWLCVDDFAQPVVEVISNPNTSEIYTAPSAGTPTGTLIHSSNPDTETPNWNSHQGEITATTFLGDLNGTINTATTGTTQTAGNNSTLIATTAYADAAAAAVPIGNYLPLAGGTMTGDLKLNDNVDLYLGTGNDFQAYHDGSNTYLRNLTGDFYIRQDRVDASMIFQCDDGAGGLETYFQLEGASGGASPFTVFPDSSTLAFGSGHDMRLYHNNGGFIDNYTGVLQFTNYADDSDIVFRSDNGSGGVENYIQIDGSEGRTTFNKTIRLNDNVQLQIGSSNDAYITHNGTNTYFVNGVGNLEITNDTNDGDIIFKSDDGSGGVTEYFKLWGLISSILISKDVLIGNDTAKLKFGASQDLQIYHDGTNSYIENNTGDLYIRSNFQDRDIILQSDNGGGGIATYIQLDGSTGAVDLNHYGSNKLKTTSTGVSVTGSIQIDSALLSNQENTDIDSAAAEVVAQVSTTYTAAFFDFVVKKTTNVRSGTVYACHDGTSVMFTETSTNDLGDTSDVTLSVDISGGNMRLLATVTSDDWSVKSLIRAI